MSQIEKLLSVKEKPMILHGGHFYTIERTTTTKIIFRCQNRDCKARCHTNLSTNAFLSQPTSHSHAPQPDRIPAIQSKNDIKAGAVITDEPTSSIIHSVLRTYPVSATGELPRNEALMLMIRQQRTTETVDVDGCLPEKLRKTYRDEDFILHEDKKLIIFTTKTNLFILKQNRHWVLERDNFQLESIMTDFETGTIKSVKEILPSVSHKGCLFHFGQAVWRQVQSKGLTTKYNEDESFRLSIKKLIALAFVALGQVIAGFDLICD
ncbi:unnamed protein product [Rotaria magnacalcarata]|uniref:FLYWCH-type domain-containing protein n=1 Tax=Rotaria magnacalcarata TaxID=392030 RepID=A0A816Z4H4_9BILA|nr:unnamed protein product [Rotaria magnacalcarata]CAF3817590.1 unnamed protein product [Rotaria magnacalcarata]